MRRGEVSKVWRSYVGWGVAKSLRCGRSYEGWGVAKSGWQRWGVALWVKAWRSLELTLPVLGCGAARSLRCGVATWDEAWRSGVGFASSGMCRRDVSVLGGRNYVGWGVTKSRDGVTSSGMYRSEVSKVGRIYVGWGVAKSGDGVANPGCAYSTYPSNYESQ